MASSMKKYDTDEEEEDLETSQWYGVREATLFLVDATQKMFEVDPETERSYIHGFFKLYKRIMRQKLAWNMQDWMGVVLFGTEECDDDFGWKNIQTLQKLAVVTLDDLQRVRELTKNGIKDYKSMQSDDTYPLHDALSYATEIFLKTKTVLTKRRIILITCHNPELENDEKQRIRLRTASLKDLDIKLHVIGIGENWIYNRFYKDLEILSRKTNLDVYKRISLADLLQQIRTPPRNLARVCFKICGGLEIDLVVRTLSRYRNFRTTVLSNANNEVLTRAEYYKNEDSSDEDGSDSENINLPYVMPNDVDLETVELIGDRRLYFKQKEIPQLKLPHDSDIKLIGIKPIPDDFFKYHVKRCYFAKADYNSSRKDNLLFFAALLNKCATKKKMIVCTFALRTNTQVELCYMIPKMESGGFYLSKVSYEANLEEKDDELQYYKTQNQTTDEEIALWKKTINQLNINYRPHMFKSYNLECQIQLVEELALDKKPAPPPVDSIEQSYLNVQKEMAELVHEFKNMYPDISENDQPSTAKKAKRSKRTS